MKEKKSYSEMTPEEYYEFLWTYTTFDKTREQLIRDLELSVDEQEFLDEALKYLKSRVEVHKKEGRPSPSYAFYLIESIDEELDPGIPREITDMIKRTVRNGHELPTEVADMLERALRGKKR